MAALKCLGNCSTCEHLVNGDVDEVICPLRVSMIYIRGVDAKINRVLEMLESAESKTGKSIKFALVEVGTDEISVEESLKTKEDEK